MIFKCKICGGELNVERGQSIVECEYCGVKQTLPRFLDENTKLMYDRANSYLMHNEFDKAENIYNQILFADREDADAYWSLVLCKYGISYVKDPKTQKYIPTCNRTYYSSIFDDENYKNAIKYANAEKAELFKTDAKTIDDIQRGIVAISRKEKPFDIFISYKETGVSGGRTRDSIVAQDLYEELTAEGYKVFFSRITLEDKIGTEYEPYIYAALASSKVMISVCSSKENIESVWVKNEWSRFMSFMQKDSAKTILPLYFDMDKSDLPDEFAHLPSFNMKSQGFEQDLIRGIKKLIPLPIMEKERREKRKKLFKKIGIGAAACLVIAAICMIPWFMKLPDYNAAMQLYYDKNYPEATWAFDELGGYRNSTEMKDKCEKSWRKSLANTVCIDEYVAYYISPNGTVEYLSGSGSGKEENEVKLNEHGKYVSIMSGDKSLYAMHEDGYVENLAENNGTNKDWENIIQISKMFNNTAVALKSNGTMTFGKPIYDTVEIEGYTHSYDWLETIKNWKNIIYFDADVSMIIGVQSNGKLVGGIDPEIFDSASLNKILSDFSDIKSARFSLRYNGNSNESKVTIAAITKHNTVQIYDNEFYEIPAENTIDMIPYFEYSVNPNIIDKTYRLTDNGNVIDENDKVILKDIVKIDDSATIARNGTIYLHKSADGKQPEKSVVYDEWIERMK